jgi:hypothetical protein
MWYLLVLENKKQFDMNIKRKMNINNTNLDYQKEIVADEDYYSLLLLVNLYLLELIQV